jgi:hypothetical protein
MNYTKQLPMPIGSFPTDVTFPMPPQVSGPLEDDTQTCGPEPPAEQPSSDPKEKGEDEK